MLILDTSEIQARKPNPQAREISRLTWRAASIPQNAIPFTVPGKPYLLEFDEYTQGTTGGGDKHAVGAARIIDISDERKPRVVVEPAPAGQPAGRPRQGGAATPAPSAPCRATPRTTATCRRRMDPKVVACSFIASGLRVFDISELTKPKEIAYYVPPTQGQSGEQVRRQRLRDVQARVRAEPARDLVHATGRPASTRCAWPRTCGPTAARPPRLPGAPLADRAAQHRPRAARADPQAAAPPRARARAGAPSAHGAGA